MSSGGNKRLGGLVTENQELRGMNMHVLETFSDKLSVYHTIFEILTGFDQL